MSDSIILRTMRVMAWERACGELESMLHTFHGEGEQFDRLARVVETFIRKVIDEGLAE